MDRIFEAIEEWMRNLLTGMVSSNLTTMYTDVNEKTGQIAAQVGQTPQGWNGNIFSMIQNLSDSVIVPIAGMIITFVLCYELISMLTERTICMTLIHGCSLNIFSRCGWQSGSSAILSRLPWRYLMSGSQ